MIRIQESKMTSETLARRCQEEHDNLANIKEALRVTLSWHTPSIGNSRKIHSLAFIIRALQRHLEQQLSLEEHSHNVDDAGCERPSLTGEALRLRLEHDEFRQALHEMLPVVEQLQPEEGARCEYFCREVSGLLERIEAHELNEAELLQEAYCQDDGGEG